jgi:urease accessory protein
MKQGATQQLTVQLADDSAFCFLTHPTVPHEQSIFTTHNNFYLSNNHQFIFGEVLTCGRKLNGEVFLFSKYHSITQIFINNKLVIKENLLMQPSFINVHAIGQLESFTHQASMIYLQPNVDCKILQSTIIELLSTEKNMELGITAAPVNGLIIRLLGHGAAQLYNCLQRVAVILQTQTIKTLQHAG